MWMAPYCILMNGIYLINGRYQILINEFKLQISFFSQNESNESRPSNVHYFKIFQLEKGFQTKKSCIDFKYLQ